MSEGSAAQWVAVPWFLSVPAASDLSCSDRSRLREMLDSSVRNRTVTVLAAPSGYGKTTLLAQWTHATDSAVEWFTVPDQPGDQQQMLITGIIAAAQRHVDGRRAGGNQGSAGASVPGQPSIEMLGRVVLSVGSPLVVIIDDAHHVGDALASDLLERVTGQSGGTIRFVISGHGTLAGVFAKSVAADRATLITAADLSFTVNEIQADWTASGIQLTLENASSLRELSGGWPIAIRAMKIALSTGSDWRHEPAGASINEKLAAYIEQVVLAGLRPDLREFILAATTCGRLTADLARQITGADDAAALLEECANAGIFLSRRTDADGVTVYFWHEVFARHCRSVLARATPSAQRQLNAAAARWLAPHFPNEAIRHALAARNADLAARLITTWWTRIVIESGAHELDTHCASLPPELRGKNPDILWIRAVCRDVLGEIASASMLAQRAANMTRTSRTALLARLILEDDPKELAQTADAVSALLVDLEGQDDAQPYRLFLLGWTELRLRRAPHRAAQLLQTTIREADANGAVDLRQRAQENLAFTLAYGGHLSEAIKVLDQPAEPESRKEWLQYDGGIRDFTLGFVEYWRGDTASADRRFRALLDGSGEGAAYTALAAMFHALCAATSRDPLLIADAQARLHLLRIVRPSGIPWTAYHAVSTAALDASTGQSARLSGRLETLTRFQHVPAALAIGAELLREAGDLDQAMRFLRSIKAGAKTSYIAASALTTSALIAHQRGIHKIAHEQFERALNTGVPEGITRPFSARSRLLIDLMNAHRSRGTDHDAFLTSRIATFQSDALEPATRPSVLSDRQQQVFGYLRTALSVNEIAEMLGVSVNTIRTHQRAIYRKLGVTSRREAVQRRFTT